VPTAATITDHVMTGPSTEVSEQCRSPGRVEELLNDAARLSVERRRDRDEGAAFDSAFQFFRECEEELHGKACTVDAHCSYGAACRYGACTVAEGAAEAEATLRCFVDRMDGETLGLLRRDLGLTGNCEYRTCPVDYPEGEQCADRERVANTSVPCFVEFRDVFLSEFTADDCVGPGADAYRASVDLYGEDAAGRPAAVVTPPDAAGCVAEQVCTGDPDGFISSPPDCGDANESFCAVCDAPGVCFDVTTPARCYVPSLNQTECAGCAEGCGGRHPECGTGCPLEWDVESRDPTLTPHIPHISGTGCPLAWDVEAQMCGDPTRATKESCVAPQWGAAFLGHRALALDGGAWVGHHARTHTILS
jgi:hypothetical protein